MACRAAAVAPVSHLLGYARVSTGMQDESLQLDALDLAGCVQVYTDHISGTKTTRPKLDELFARLNTGDTVVVWRLDRLGRSLPHLIEVVRGLGERGVQFRSLTEQLDTSTPAGRLLFHVAGAFAEFERDLIVERTKAGLEAARARGRHGGRRPKLSAKQIEMARDMYASKQHTVADIAASFGVSRATIYNNLQSTATE